MKVFLIILAVLVLLVIIILSLSAEFTVIFDNGWSTKVRVLFIEKDIKLTQLLSFIVAPDKAGKEAAEEAKEKKEQKKAEKETEKEKTAEEPAVEEQPAEAADETKDEEPPEVTEITEQPESKEETSSKKKEKKNPIVKLWEEEGVVGIMQLLSNVVQTLNKAVTTLIKGLHIYSLYVKMIIGGGDPSDIGEKYGSVCGWYYPLKGFILNQMKVDQYDDYIQADFIAPRSEYEFQLIGSLSVGLLVKVLLKAGGVFVVNYIKNR